MKVYSIGREESCDIIIDDRTDVISRRHAALNVTSMGKMTIVDYSHNGTYVNGIRISPNVPVPVTRKDNISFAHVARLDWHVIPNTQAKIIRYAILAVVAVLLVIGGVWGYKSFSGGSGSETPVPQEAVADSTLTQKPDTLTQKPDTLKQDKDTLKQDSVQIIQIKRKAPAGKPGKNTGKGKKDAPKKEEPKQEEAPTRFR